MINIEDMLKVETCFWCNSSQLKRVAERKDEVGVQECQSCGLLQVAEMPEDLSVYYDDEEYFNPEGETVTGYHENYDLLSPFFLYWQGALVEEISRHSRAKNLLEVGCATGNALEMVKVLNKDISIYGIDLSTYAIDVCKQKGIPASVSKINGFNPKNKFDIILSSETMEHVDELREFVDAVKTNLNKDGVYVFFVPAVEKQALIKQSRDYPSLTTSLEHVSYFTAPFLEKALAEAFDGSAYIQQIPTGGDGGNYHLGFVSKDKKLISYLAKFAKAFMIYDKSINDSNSLYNLTVIAAKFSNFSPAEKYLEKLEAAKAPANKLNFLRGVLTYSKGELFKSRDYFLKYLGGAPADVFNLKVLLSVERELSKILTDDLETKIQNQRELEGRVLSAESEINSLKNSRVVGRVIKLRHATGRALDPVRNSKKKIRDRTLRSAYLLTPKPLRKHAKYVIRRQWRIKYIFVDNPKWPQGLPLVSVVIPYFNRASTIDETLESLKMQTFLNFEVIVVNDGSTETLSIEKLKNLDTAGLSARIINQKNGGVASARNKGVAQAKGKYIVCLDSDDLLDPTYIEKCTILLESDAQIDLATTDMRLFGVTNSTYKEGEYDATQLLEKNMVVTSAMFDRKSWRAVGGYKPGIGYEDWEFWINLAENGFWGKNIPEPLLNYRTAISSRYIEDKMGHRVNIGAISNLHPKFSSIIKKLKKQKLIIRNIVTNQSLFTNLNDRSMYKPNRIKRPNILLTSPWMTFGGAETLIYNFCLEIKNDYNIHFITGLKSDHEWEYKFREISDNIYHLPNLFDDYHQSIEFVSNYISTRGIEVVHIIHNGFMFRMLPELKRRHPSLAIIVTMFNDWVEYFPESIKAESYVDAFASDNEKVAQNYRRKLSDGEKVKVVPNGINCYDKFNPEVYDRHKQRGELGLTDKDIAVFFIGRLSHEKNPDVFVDVANRVLSGSKQNRIKFFIIGDGPMKGEIQRGVNTTNSDNIKYLGYQSDIAKYLSAADVFILPSSIEGFPLSILEAMAMKVAVIASDVGAVSDVIEPGVDGFVVEPGSVKDITECLMKLIDSPVLLSKVKNLARKKVETKYSNRILGDNYRKLYGDLLK